MSLYMAGARLGRDRPLRATAEPPAMAGGRMGSAAIASHSGPVWWRLTHSLQNANELPPATERPRPAHAYVKDPWENLDQLAQAKIDVDRVLLKRELRIGDTDFVEVPVVFGGDTTLDGQIVNAIARTGDSVNMLVLNNDDGKHFVIAKPFGPVMNGVYVFERCIELALRSLGWNNLHFVNDWQDFHENHGEIHCGTNQIPREREIRWWEHSEAFSLQPQQEPPAGPPAPPMAQGPAPAPPKDRWKCGLCGKKFRDAIKPMRCSSCYASQAEMIPL